MACSHLGEIELGIAPRTDGCEVCLREGRRWVQLRMCLSCGNVGCCDSSPGKHASAHFRATAHPVMRAFMAPRDFAWCYADEEVLDASLLDRARDQLSPT